MPHLDGEGGLQFKEQTLTVALSNTLMEKGSATLCLRRACSSSWRGGRSHFPNTTRSMSLSTQKEIKKKKVSILTNKTYRKEATRFFHNEQKGPHLVGRYSPVLKLPNIWTWKNSDSDTKMRTQIYHRPVIFDDQAQTLIMH